MNKKTIWLLAAIFGTITTGVLYVSLYRQPVQPANSIPAASTSIKEPAAASAPADSSLPISQGKRAISIAVNEVQGVSGFLASGSYVDAVVILPPPQGENATAQILLQNIKVLAVGHTSLNTNKDKDPKGVTYQTVTLEVSPQEGTSLAFAVQKGSVHLMLRKPGDAALSPPARMTLDELGKGGTAK